jgi:hypothetical protein
MNRQTRVLQHSTGPAALAEPRPARSDRGARLARVLNDQGMPPRDIRIVLQADDPVMVRRYLELHRERLEERLAAQIRALEAIDREVIADRR